MGRPEHTRCADRAARERPAPPAALARSADGRGVDIWAVELEGAMGDGVYSRVGSLKKISRYEMSFSLHTGRRQSSQILSVRTSPLSQMDLSKTSELRARSLPVSVYRLVSCRPSFCLNCIL